MAYFFIKVMEEVLLKENIYIEFINSNIIPNYLTKLYNKRCSFYQKVALTLEALSHKKSPL
jgi:hypothetical protein